MKTLTQKQIRIILADLSESKKLWEAEFYSAEHHKKADWAKDVIKNEIEPRTQLISDLGRAYWGE